MSNEVSNTKSALPAAVVNMKTALAASIAGAGTQAGNDFYGGMDKYGTHYYGADRTEILDTDQWAVNIASPQTTHGFTAWGTEAHDTDGQNVGEVMVPISQPMPLESDLPDVKGKWSKAICLQMRCIEGEDEGTQILWKTNSHGGRKAYSALMISVMEKISADDPAFIPAILLTSDSYKHKTYGKIFTPVFEVARWVTMDGVAEAEPEKATEAQEEKAEEPVAEEKPARRRRRKAS